MQKAVTEATVEAAAVNGVSMVAVAFAADEPYVSSGLAALAVDDIDVVEINQPEAIASLTLTNYCVTATPKNGPG